MKKKLNKNSFITAVCTFLIVITTFASVSAFASTYIGTRTIPANSATATIGDVTKADSVNCSTIFFKCSTTFIIKTWVYDVTRSSTLSDKKSFFCTGTKTGHHVYYKSGASYGSRDTVRFYASQSTNSSKTIDFTIFGDKAVL